MDNLEKVINFNIPQRNRYLEEAIIMANSECNEKSKKPFPYGEAEPENIELVIYDTGMPFDYITGEGDIYG